jgi:hypothetical protein
VPLKTNPKEKMNSIPATKKKLPMKEVSKSVAVGSN